MEIMSKKNVNGKEMLVGVQNFTDGTVDVKVDDTITTCTMFQDKDGDIGFMYEGKEIYFNQTVIRT